MTSTFYSTVCIKLDEEQWKKVKESLPNTLFKNDNKSEDISIGDGKIEDFNLRLFVTQDGSFILGIVVYSVDFGEIKDIDFIDIYYKSEHKSYQLYHFLSMCKIDEPIVSLSFMCNE